MLRLSRRLDEQFRVAALRPTRLRQVHAPRRPVRHGRAGRRPRRRCSAGRRAVIVGHSYGGNVALATAERHPSLVAGVVIYETPLSWEPWWPGTTAGAVAIKAAGQPEEAAEAFMRRIIGVERWEALPSGHAATRRAEGVALVDELADLREHQPVARRPDSRAGRGGLRHPRRRPPPAGHAAGGDDDRMAQNWWCSRAAATPPRTPTPTSFRRSAGRPAAGRASARPGA